MTDEYTELRDKTGMGIADMETLISDGVLVQVGLTSPGRYQARAEFSPHKADTAQGAVWGLLDKIAAAISGPRGRLMNGGSDRLPDNPAPATEHPQPTVVEMRGVDLSRWQGDWDPSTPELDVDWGQVYAAGYRFAIVKITNGVGYDWRLGQQLARGAKEVGLLLMYYHFGTPHELNGLTPEQDGVIEATEFVNSMLHKNTPHPDRVMFESGRECEGLVDLEKVCPKLDKRGGYEWCAAYLHTVFNEGFLVGIYTKLDWLESEVEGYERLFTRPDGSELPFWVARYGHNDGQVPELPKYSPLKKVPPAWGAWDIWQYSSQGRVPGIKNRVDLNLARIVTR